LLVGCVLGLLVAVLPPTVGEATVPGLLVVGVTPAMELPVEAAPGKVVSVGDVASLGPIGDDTGVAEQVSSRVQSVVVGAIEESEPDWASFFRGPSRGVSAIYHLEVASVTWLSSRPRTTM